VQINGCYEQQICYSLFIKELKNIENRVAWFLAELCNAEKGVQKDNLKPAPGRAR
jgi:hypothetical protein